MRFSKDTLRKVAWLGVDKFGRALVYFAATVLIARYLGPNMFGVLSYHLSILALVVPIAVFGTERTVVQLVIANPTRSGSTVASAMVLRLLSAVVCAALFLGFPVLTMPWADIPWLLLVPLSLVLFLQATEVLEYYLHAHLRTQPVAFVRLGAAGMYLLTSIAVIAAGGTVEHFGLVKLAEAAGYSLLIVAIGWRSLRELGPTVLRPRLMHVRRLVYRGRYIMLAAFAVVVYLRIDQVMLMHLSTPDQVGMYAMAAKIVESLYLVSPVLVTMMQPSILSARRDHAELLVQVRRYANMIVITSYAITAFTILLAPVLVPFAFGPEFEGSIISLQVLALTLVFVLLGGVRTIYLVAIGETKSYMLTTISALILNVALNLALIPAYGAVGAAIATVVSYWFAGHGSCFFLSRLRPVGYAMTLAMIWPFSSHNRVSALGSPRP